MATKKTGASKKSAKKSKKSPKAKLATAKPVSLRRYFTTLESSVKTIEAAGGAVGACLVTDPHSGTTVCVRADQKTCKALKGVFVGGPCG